MTEKLVWDYDQSTGEHYAIVKRNYQTYRIRAVHDSTPQNPFTDGDQNWPIVVRSPDAFHDIKGYYFGNEKTNPTLDTVMFNDAALVHNQIHIAKVLGSDVPCIIHEWGGWDYDDPIPKYCPDADILRQAFDQRISDDLTMSKALELAEELFTLAGWPCYRTTVTGYSQGDWAEVLVVATPEAQAKFGCTEPPKPEDLKTTAKLYGWWAFGDIYGYIVERRCVGDSFDEDDGTDEEWEELDDGSCWGFYGPDHDQSGLEESALECIPDEIMKEAA